MPDKNINQPINGDLHRTLKILSSILGKSLKDIVIEALQDYVNKNKKLLSTN